MTNAAYRNPCKLQPLQYYNAVVSQYGWVKFDLKICICNTNTITDICLKSEKSIIDLGIRKPVSKHWGIGSGIVELSAPAAHVLRRENSPPVSPGQC